MPLLQEDVLRMVRVLRLLRHRMPLTCTLLRLLADASSYLLLCLRPAPVLAAENLFLRKQLALYHERNVKPRRAINATRITLVWLGRWFAWRQALAIGQPETFPLASPRVSPVLALEISSWTRPNPSGAPSPHPSYGPRAPHMGPRAYCQ